MLDQEVQRRMDAYRGNPQMLMQRYQQSQQLIDLLALQEIKSRKEAAVREMQMRMAQNQPGGLPTIAEQREKEVMDLTRQELVQQIGSTLQQQAQAKQAAMQKLMGGLTQAPGAGSAMQPQAMAAGGIVAFQAGGTPEDQIPLEMTDESPVDPRDREKGLIELLRRLGVSPEQYAQQLAARRAGSSFPYPEEGTTQDLSGAERNAPRTPSALERARAAMVARESGNVPAPAAGLGALPAGQSRLRDEIKTSIGTGGTADQNSALGELRAAITELKKPQDFPEIDVAGRQQAIAERRAAMEKEFNPNRQRLNSLIEFLAGGAGRTSLGSVGAGAARAGTSYEARQEAARRERVKEIGQMEEDLRKQREAQALGKMQLGLKTTELGLKAHEQLAALSTKVAEGNADRANRLANTALELAGRKDISTDEQLTRLRIAAAELGLKADDMRLTNMIRLANVEVEQDKANKAARPTDLTNMAGVLAKRIRQQNPGMSEEEVQDKAYRETASALGRYPGDVRAGLEADKAKLEAERLKEFVERGVTNRTSTLRMQLQGTKNPKRREELQAEITRIENEVRSMYPDLYPQTAPAKPAAPAAGAAATGVMPLPSDQKDLQVGKVYNTSRGPAMWNGKQFVQ